MAPGRRHSCRYRRKPAREVRHSTKKRTRGAPAHSLPRHVLNVLDAVAEQDFFSRALHVLVEDPHRLDLGLVGREDKVRLEARPRLLVRGDAHQGPPTHPSLAAAPSPAGQATAAAQRTAGGARGGTGRGARKHGGGFHRLQRMRGVTRC